MADAPEVPEVDVTEAKQRVDAGAFVLDVRNEDEWSAGRLDGSTLIPMQQVVTRRDELPSDREIVVVCRSGARSGRVATVLALSGYDAVNVAGGLETWIAAGLPFSGTVA
jgi:rhodanese-related sulfurtransferase